MDKRKMPDVALDSSLYAPLDQVGMGDIEVPVLLAADDGALFRVPAKVSAKVSLDRASSRGIHMSRLYLLVQEHLGQKPLSFELLRELTELFLSTHQDLSRHAFIEVRFEAPLKRKALKSDFRAWRSYPVTLSAENYEGTVRIFAEILVMYSSTCPASAALSRQLIQENFSRDFRGRDDFTVDDVHQWLGSASGVLATPHAQRSEARVKVEIARGHGPVVGASADFGFATLIDTVEEALQTPVQGAVKREDEQEFALRNGQNLMFCEDAARRIKSALDEVGSVNAYRVFVKHLESLHPHNAEALVTHGNIPSF
jgi:GTP cyclohydrolase I